MISFGAFSSNLQICTVSLWNYLIKLKWKSKYLTGSGQSSQLLQTMPGLSNLLQGNKVTIMVGTWGQGGGHPFSCSPQSNWEPLLISLSLLVRPVVYIQSFTLIGVTKKQRPRQPAGRGPWDKRPRLTSRGNSKHGSGEDTEIWPCMLPTAEISGWLVCMCLYAVCMYLNAVCMDVCVKARANIPQKQGLAINLKAHSLWPISSGQGSASRSTIN